MAKHRTWMKSTFLYCCNRGSHQWFCTQSPHFNRMPWFYHFFIQTVFVLAEKLPQSQFHFHRRTAFAAGIAKMAFGQMQRHRALNGVFSYACITVVSVSTSLSLCERMALRSHCNFMTIFWFVECEAGRCLYYRSTHLFCRAFEFAILVHLLVIGKTNLIFISYYSRTWFFSSVNSIGHSFRPVVLCLYACVMGGIFLSTLLALQPHKTQHELPQFKTAGEAQCVLAMISSVIQFCCCITPLQKWAWKKYGTQFSRLCCNHHCTYMHFTQFAYSSVLCMRFTFFWHKNVGQIFT